MGIRCTDMKEMLLSAMYKSVMNLREVKTSSWRDIHDRSETRCCCSMLSSERIVGDSSRLSDDTSVGCAARCTWQCLSVRKFNGDATKCSSGRVSVVHTQGQKGASLRFFSHEGGLLLTMLMDFN